MSALCLMKMHPPHLSTRNCRVLYLLSSTPGDLSKRIETPFREVTEARSPTYHSERTHQTTWSLKTVGLNQSAHGSVLSMTLNGGIRKSLVQTGPTCLEVDKTTARQSRGKDTSQPSLPPQLQRDFRSRTRLNSTCNHAMLNWNQKTQTNQRPHLRPLAHTPFPFILPTEISLVGQRYRYPQPHCLLVYQMLPQSLRTSLRTKNLDITDSISYGCLVCSHLTKLLICLELTILLLLSISLTFYVVFLLSCILLEKLSIILKFHFNLSVDC